MTPTDFAKVGLDLCKVVVLMGFLNVGCIIWGICEVLFEAMSSRESTFIGRLLRYWFKVRIAEPPECNCDCCTCSEDRRKGFNSPQYERHNWFEIIPYICDLDENAPATHETDKYVQALENEQGDGTAVDDLEGIHGGQPTRR